MKPEKDLKENLGGACNQLLSSVWTVDVRDVLSNHYWAGISEQMSVIFMALKLGPSAIFGKFHKQVLQLNASNHQQPQKFINIT